MQPRALHLVKLFLDALQAPNQSGTGTYVLQLLERLPKSPDIQSPTALVRPGTPAPDWEVLPLARRTRFASIYRRHIQFGRYLEETQSDIVHFPANFGTFFPIRAMHSPTVVTTLHDLTFFRNPGWFPMRRALLYQSLAWRTVRQSDLLIADSACTADDIQRYLGVTEDRIQLVPLGTAPPSPAASTDIAEIRSRYHLPQTFFLFVGTIEPRKNLPRLIRAWDSIAGNCGCNLVIAGREGWKTREYRSALKGARHASRIHTLGFVPSDDLHALYSAATAFVWPSLCEGFGLPPLDAMACGVPVLTSATSSLPEVTGDAALLVDPEDESAIASGLLRILRDEKLRDQLIEAGRERARMLSWDSTIEKTVHAYRRAIELRR